MNHSVVPKINAPKKVVDHIVGWLENYLRQSDMNGFVVGVSGGIDSALTSTLCALTNKKTICVEININQQEIQVQRSHRHMEWLTSQYSNVEVQSINLTKVFEAFIKSVPKKEDDSDELSLANSRSRLRMVTLYYLAGTHRYLVVGTGNKVEDFGVGFFTKYGDGGVDISPIADLLKSHVYQLATYLGINKEILVAPPTDGLWDDNRTDQDQLGLSYDQLEWAMETINRNDVKSENDSHRKHVIETYQRFNSTNKHKMVPIPVCNIPEDYFY